MVQRKGKHHDESQDFHILRKIGYKILWPKLVFKLGLRNLGNREREKSCKTAWWIGAFCLSQTCPIKVAYTRTQFTGVTLVIDRSDKPDILIVDPRSAQLNKQFSRDLCFELTKVVSQTSKCESNEGFKVLWQNSSRSSRSSGSIKGGNGGGGTRKGGGPGPQSSVASIIVRAAEVMTSKQASIWNEEENIDWSVDSPGVTPCLEDFHICIAAAFLHNVKRRDNNWTTPADHASGKWMRSNFSYHDKLHSMLPCLFAWFPND